MSKVECQRKGPTIKYETHKPKILLRAADGVKMLLWAHLEEARLYRVPAGLPIGHPNQVV